MKRCLSLFVLAGTATLAWPQAAPKPATAPPAKTTTPAPAGPRGPEAIASQEPNKVVATINGKPVTAKEAYDLLKMIPEAQRKSLPNQEQVLERLYMLNDLAHKAEAQHLDQTTPVKEQLQLQRDNILAQAYMEGLTAKSGQPTEDPQAYYNGHQDQFDLAKLSGIVVAFNPPGTPASAGGVNRTEQEAQQKADDVEKKLKAGADFATLARTESDDQRSSANGGDLGNLAAGSPNVPADIKNTVFNKLQPGQVSEPLRTGNAFYILKLDSRTKVPFDQAKNEIVQKLKADHSQAIVKQESEKYKIQVQDPNFFSSTATPSLTGSLRK